MNKVPAQTVYCTLYWSTRYNTQYHGRTNLGRKSTSTQHLVSRTEIEMYLYVVLTSLHNSCDTFKVSYVILVFNYCYHVLVVVLYSSVGFGGASLSSPRMYDV